MTAAETRLPSSTVEDYLKAILELQRTNDTELVAMGLLAACLNLTPGTITTMVRRLTADGLATYEPRRGCGLTDTGRRIALRTLRRHRVLETFLVQVLGMDWSQVHDEAERMEHGISDEVIDRIWAFMERPAFDPHGGLIPDPDLHWPVPPGEVPLTDLPDGIEAEIVRIPDRSPGLLQSMAEAGILPGKRFRSEHRSGTGTVTLSGSLGRVTLSLEMAATLTARPLRSP